ncbi:MAG: phosphonoacetaldehyde hydrolase [Clostridiaceae bacterium]|nr:phosphonoacetaldehyde hydrolase [Clostridiaceae bacterium]
MNQGIKAVIFDWAGTTVDYGCFAPIRAFIDGFRSIGIDITNDMAREPMGLSKIDHVRTIAAMLPEPLSEEEILRAYGVFEETLFANIERHCDIKDHVLTTVTALRERGIKIGSTTGYTSAMMEYVLRGAAEQGYSPDFCVSADLVAAGRPHPYMIQENIRHFGISDAREVVKVGDTVADIAEGKSADCWTVGVVMGSSELGLTRDEVSALSEDELEERKASVRATFFEAGADYVIDDMNEFLDVIADINRKISANSTRAEVTVPYVRSRELKAHHTEI